MPFGKPWLIQDVELEVRQVPRDLLIGFAAACQTTDAVNIARSDYGVKLDFSIDSIRQVDSILDKIYRELPRGIFARLRRKTVPEDAIFEMSKPWGCYVGEVLRITSGWRWCTPDEQPQCMAYYTLIKGSSKGHPVNKAFKRLADGPNDDMWSFYQLCELLDKERESTS